jgi:hypothetical protein
VIAQVLNIRPLSGFPDLSRLAQHSGQRQTTPRDSPCEPSHNAAQNVSLEARQPTSIIDARLRSDDSVGELHLMTSTDAQIQLSTHYCTGCGKSVVPAKYCASCGVFSTPPKLPLSGWLKWFVIRFYIGAIFAFAGAAENRSRSVLVTGILFGLIELTIGILLSMRNRTGLILTRIWLILEVIGYGLLATLSLVPPADSEGASRLVAYSIGATILTIYFFRSKQVELTYPRRAR